MKVIRFNTPDGEYQIPLRKVAEHRAEYYCGKNREAFSANVNYVMEDDYEGIDWLINNTDYEDWEDIAVKFSDKCLLQEDFWTCSDDFEIVEIPE